jgi:hypothetical protein
MNNIALRTEDSTRIWKPLQETKMVNAVFEDVGEKSGVWMALRYPAHETSQQSVWVSPGKEVLLSFTPFHSCRHFQTVPSMFLSITVLYRLLHLQNVTWSNRFSNVTSSSPYIFVNNSQLIHKTHNGNYNCHFKLWYFLTMSETINLLTFILH